MVIPTLLVEINSWKPFCFDLALEKKSCFINARWRLLHLFRFWKLVFFTDLLTLSSKHFFLNHKISTSNFIAARFFFLHATFRGWCSIILYCLLLALLARFIFMIANLKSYFGQLPRLSPVAQSQPLLDSFFVIIPIDLAPFSSFPIDLAPFFFFPFLFTRIYSPNEERR